MLQGQRCCLYYLDMQQSDGLLSDSTEQHLEAEKLLDSALLALQFAKDEALHL